MKIKSLFDLSKDVVIITGARGLLGLQYVRVFLECGATVIGLDLDGSVHLNEVLRKFPKKFFFFPGDVTEKSSLLRVLVKVRDLVGVPTVLINNAAIDSPPSAPLEENGPFENYPEESWDKVLDVNLKGTYLCCQVFGSAMAQSGYGSIINVSSIYGLVSPDQSLYEYRRARGENFFKPIAYGASKSGILNMSRYLAVYWGKSGVRVNTVTIAGVFNGQDRDFLDAYCGRIPIGRMAQVNEYDGVMVFLASRASVYMTGSNLVVDGGWTAI